MSGSTNFSSSEDAAIPDPALVTVGNGLDGPSLAAPEKLVSDVLTYASATAATNPNPESWRDEVAARLERYRTRRKPRSPRYPSLLLPFDAPASWSRPAPLAGSLATAPSLTSDEASNFCAGNLNIEGTEGAAIAQLQFAHHPSVEDRISEHQDPLEQRADGHSDFEQSAKVIEFPRSAAVPVFRGDELAEPIFDRDRPRIVEAPEILPPPPALGGIVIASIHPDLPARRSGSDFPLASASSATIARRILAALVDGAILGGALTAFAAIFLRMNPVHGSLPLFAGALVAMALVLWIAYEFLFVVYTGSTPGLRTARLQLARFDGSPLSRRVRRWRVLASFLSAFAAGLGYLWCILDQDQLCWHDRITHTHVQMAERLEQ
jgi:uncharacterized RDD family membrane protein YckC